LPLVMFRPPFYFEPRRNTGCLRLSKLIVENEGSKGKVAVGRPRAY
jgi:hypothetical protein